MLIEEFHCVVKLITHSAIKYVVKLKEKQHYVHDFHRVYDVNVYSVYFVHVLQNRYGYLEESIQIKRPGEFIVKYFIQIGDELVLAPLCLFYPEMMALQGMASLTYHVLFILYKCMSVTYPTMENTSFCL